jgi:hypothetical protein
MRSLIKAICGNSLKAQYTRTVPAHGTLEFLEVDSDEQLAAGLSIINLEVQTGCSFVSLYPVDANNMALSGEIAFPITQRRQRLSALMPKGTCGIVLKNLTSVSSPRKSRITDVSYSRFDDISGSVPPATEEMIEQAEKKVFIHSVGKSGSASLQETLHPLQKVVCARDHFVNLPNLSLDTGRVGPALLGALSLQKLTSCRIVMHLLRTCTSRPGSVDVICGLRRFDTLLLAGVFQNRGMSYVNERLSADDVLQRIYDASRESWLPHFQYWWEKEFFLTHGFTMAELERGLKKERFTWVFKAANGINYRFYRIEDGENALKECLAPYGRFSSDPASFPRAVSNTNTAAQKGYSDLYSKVKARVDVDYIRSWRSSLIEKIEALFYGE